MALSGRDRSGQRKRNQDSARLFEHWRGLEHRSVLLADVFFSRPVGKQKEALGLSDDEQSRKKDKNSLAGAALPD